MEKWSFKSKHLEYSLYHYYFREPSILFSVSKFPQLNVVFPAFLDYDILIANGTIFP
jgi:hypothetical protein